tara:strand:- start:275 stop:640 length:366 start_codon:yes stop_codon:yes gene_type:complete
MNIIEFNLLKEEIKKKNYQEAFDRETICALLDTAEHAERKARKTLSALLNSQAKTIDAYRAKLDLVVEKLYDLKYGDGIEDIQTYVYNLMEDLYINNVSPDDLDRDKIDIISTEFQKFRDL